MVAHSTIECSGKLRRARQIRRGAAIILAVVGVAATAGCSGGSSDEVGATWNQSAAAKEYDALMGNVWAREASTDEGIAATTTAKDNLGALRDALISDGADEAAVNTAIAANERYLTELLTSLNGEPAADAVATDALEMHRAYQDVYEGAPDIARLEPVYPGMKAHIGAIYRTQFQTDPRPPNNEEAIVWRTWWEQTGGNGYSEIGDAREYPENPTVEKVRNLSLPTPETFSDFRSAQAYYDGIATLRAGDCNQTLELAFVAGANSAESGLGDTLLVNAVRGCRNHDIGGWPNLGPPPE